MRHRDRLVVLALPAALSFDGLHRHPLLDAARRETFEALMRRIVDVLTSGAMRPYAKGLSVIEIEAIAGHLR